MGPNMYLYEKAHEEHSQDLLRKAEMERMIVQLPWHRLSMSRRVAGKLGVLRLQLGAQLKQFEHAQTAREKHV